MFVVIFEVTPKEGQADTYFDMAAELKPLLLEQPGFLSVERFQSLMEWAIVKYLSMTINTFTLGNYTRLHTRIHRQI